MLINVRGVLRKQTFQAILVVCSRVLWESRSRISASIKQLISELMIYAHVKVELNRNEGFWTSNDKHEVNLIMDNICHPCMAVDWLSWGPYAYASQKTNNVLVILVSQCVLLGMAAAAYGTYLHFLRKNVQQTTRRISGVMAFYLVLVIVFYYAKTVGYFCCCWCQMRILWLVPEAHKLYSRPFQLNLSSRSASSPFVGLCDLRAALLWPLYGGKNSVIFWHLALPENYA